MAADKVPSVRMELQNTPFTVQLGRGASIQLANAVINTGDFEATIRFGSLEFSAATAKAAAVPIHGITVQGHSARSISTEIHARRVNSVQQPRAARTATAKAVQQNRTSVFERLSHPEVSTVKKTDIKQKTLPILSSVITLPTKPFVPGRHDHEASSSGGRLSRRQRRKLNAKLRAQQPLPVHPSTLPALEPEANVPTQNKFTNLKWVKRNSSTGELKQSFWEQQQQAPAPQKKKYETLSARVHRVLKVARENGLMKKKYQKLFINKTARIPQRELPAARVTQEKLKSTPRGEHWSMKPELRIQESADKRSRWKRKEIWRPRLPERRLLEKNIRIGVTSSIASQRSASKKNHQQWVPKEKVPIINAYNSRHFGESSKESYCQPTSTYQKEINVDRTPPIEEVPVPHAEPEIYWKRRSEIRVQGNDDEEDTMEVEVVYMVGHGDEPHQTRGYKRRNEPGPTSSKTTTSQEDQIQYEQLEGAEVPSGDDQNDDQEEEVLAETLAQAQRRLKFQMKEKYKEISELNSKMTEMMAQMTAMMQLMQKNIITNPALVQPADHHSSIPTNLPTNPVPQVSGIRTAHEEENEADRLDHLQTHQNVASASDPVMTPQLESIINEKIKAVIASEQVITSSPILPIDEEDKIKGRMMSEKDEWQTAISKKTMKMIKQLEGVPGIKWKSSTEPVLELKGNPNSGASTSRSLTWRGSKTKRFYKKFSKKSSNPNKYSKLKKKRTVLQKIINNLEDYRQPARRPITLADFMSELQIDPSKVEDDEQEDEELLHVETCRVISVKSTVCQRDSIKDHDRGQIVISPTKMIDKITSESCLMVVQTDDNSEEELCFPSDDESDQQIVSQMERAKLNEDSKHTTKTSSDEVKSNEVDQVQLRSVGLPHSPIPTLKHTENREEQKEIGETYLSYEADVEFAGRLLPSAPHPAATPASPTKDPLDRILPLHYRHWTPVACSGRLISDQAAVSDSSRTQRALASLNRGHLPRRRPDHCRTSPVDSDHPDLQPHVPVFFFADLPPACIRRHLPKPPPDRPTRLRPQSRPPSPPPTSPTELPPNNPAPVPDAVHVRLRLAHPDSASLSYKISTNNERMEGKFAIMKEMLKKLLKVKTALATSEARGTNDDHGRRENPNIFRGRENTDVEVLEGEDGMSPLEPLSREEISIGFERRTAEFTGRREDAYHRGADFERGRGESNEGGRKSRACTILVNSKLIRTCFQVRCIIRNIVRDWAMEGQKERDQCYKPILEELNRLFPVRCKERPPSCLVPGAGLGRLALEISCLGFVSQGNEFSYYMMICSSFILNQTQAANQWTIFPWIHSNCNSLSDDDQFRPVSFPDIQPARLSLVNFFISERSTGITSGMAMLSINRTSFDSGGENREDQGPKRGHRIKPEQEPNGQKTGHGKANRQQPNGHRKQGTGRPTCSSPRSQETGHGKANSAGITEGFSMCGGDFIEVYNDIDQEARILLLQACQQQLDACQSSLQCCSHLGIDTLLVQLPTTAAARNSCPSSGSLRLSSTFSFRYLLFKMHDISAVILAGVYLRFISSTASWDAVATCFFLDTAHNIVEYIEVISKILKDGGVWINLGPLLYHFADAYGPEEEMSIEISLEDVKKVALQYGFEFEMEKIIETTYTANPRSMMQNHYYTAFWTMKKKPRT
ncbi:hypothetical protein M5K25_019206 [Dendrobium thyrsiflorum]|uniref:Carnosine N-methyltransferase n=2 Tax=Magnoliopsida TaxID=3398 RepID=A0ABD0UEK6_DENTH